MKKYQNVLNTRNASTFVDVANQSGSELVFGVKTAQMSRNGGSIVLVNGSLSLTRPKAVQSCTAPCEAFRYTESVSLRFNVAQFDLATLEELHTEVDRVFGLAKANLVAGVLPAVSDTFTLGE